MLDDATTGESALPHCMWCSAELPSDNEVTCPSCGATLIGDGDSPVPGVTAIDAEAIVRGARDARAKPRSRLMSWISGEYEEGESPAPPGSLAPPPPDVRREMLRLELEAQVANLQAEAGAIAAEAAVESGLPIEMPPTVDVDAVFAEAAGRAPAPSDAPAADVTDGEAAALDTVPAEAASAAPPEDQPTA
jgi:hypothetical protein